MKKLVKSVPFWIVLLVVIVFAGLATKRIMEGRKHNEVTAKPEQLQTLMPVRVFKARKDSIQEWVYGEGTVRPVRRRFLNFGQSGEVVHIGKDADGNQFREGSRVSGSAGKVPATGVPGEKERDAGKMPALPGLRQDEQRGQLLAQLDQQEVLVAPNIAQTAL
jgi:hypothetical protein